MEFIQDAKDLLETINIGVELDSGNFSAVYETYSGEELDIDYHLDNLLLVTVEKNKLEFLETLYSKNSLFFKKHNSIFSELYFCELERLLPEDVYTEMSNNIEDAFDYMNSKLNLMELSSDYIFKNYELTTEIFLEYFHIMEIDIENNVEVSMYFNAIKDSFSIISKMDLVSFQVDLHTVQFMIHPKNRDCLLLVDPIIFT